ncbi:MAG: dihydroorotase [Acidimicrobiia bacterium]|nr:dihydroorotase [Acidimicrobiia bacterium]
MTAPLLLSGGRVLTDQGMIDADVLISNGRVAAVGAGLRADHTIACDGAWVGPGFVDLHTHLREPGQEHKEDIASGARAAAAGGYTAVLAMANTSPAPDTADRVQWVLDRGEAVPDVEVATAGAVTRGRRGEELADLAAMADAGIRWFSDDGDAVATADLMRQALVILERYGAIISEHAEDASLTAGALIHEGEVSRLLGVKGMPAVAETLIIARDLLLSAETGGAVHIQHVSTAASVELIAQAKAQGLPITAEVTPHHLTFDHTELKGRNPLFKMKPPLRTEADVAAVRDALRAGIVDVVATDHAPHAPGETEEAGLASGAFGIIGLETAAAAVNTALDFDAETFFDRLSMAPARLGGFDDHGAPVTVGQPANLTVFDPAQHWTPERFVSRSRNSPFIGRPLRGRVIATVHQGRATHRIDTP